LTEAAHTKAARLYSRISNLSDRSWEDQVTTLDEPTLRNMMPMLQIHLRTAQRRLRYIKELLDLEIPHACDCDQRWTSLPIAHSPNCDLLKGCTCPSQWMPESRRRIENHDPSCTLRTWTMTPPRTTRKEEPREEVHDINQLHSPDVATRTGA
jgi:hypothetical protein